jgi:hypothetical protein
MTKLTARQRSAQYRREAAERINARERAIPLQRLVIHAICTSCFQECVCAKALDKPACERMEGAARTVIDLVRHHDLKTREGALKRESLA